MAANDLSPRLESFSIAVIMYCKAQQYDAITKPLFVQLVRSATSIGANYAEAQQGISRKDFIAKVYISKKEAAETLYWLRLLQETIEDERTSELLKEAGELMKIFQAITTKLTSS